MKKILLSARDPGAALNIYAIYMVLKETGFFQTYFVASRPAFDIVKNYGFVPEPVFFYGKENDSFNVNDDLQPLLNKADELLNKFSPDIVITGLSSFGSGIDEALILRSKVKTILYQDFWGDINSSLGKLPDLIFCLDEFAAGLTKKNHRTDCEVIGYPKTDLFKELDIKKLRNDTRKYILGDQDAKIVTWFGQSPKIPGHDTALSSLIDSLSFFDKNIVFMLKGHPKFKTDVHSIVRYAMGKCLNIVDITRYNDPVPWLVCSDIIVSAFSSCGIDHAYLSLVSYDPIGSCVYLQNNYDIRKSSFNMTGLNRIPLAVKGIGAEIYDSGSRGLKSVLLKLLEGDSRSYHERCRNNLKRFSKKELLDKILKLINGG